MSDERNLPGVTTDDPDESMADATETEDLDGAGDQDTDDGDSGLRALVQRHSAAARATANDADGADQGDEEDLEDDATATTTEADPASPDATAADAKPAEVQPDPAEEKRFSQRDLERHIGERLARDRNVKTVRELETVTGLSLDKLVEHARQNRIQTLQDQYGMDAATASQLIAQQEENQHLKAEQAAIQQERQQLAYEREKAQHLTNPLVKKYEAEIDAFTGNGTVAGLSFEDAASYILGQKVKSGELLKNVQQAAEQKTLAQVQRRGRVAPVSPTQAAAQPGALTATERALARKLGVEPKDWANEKNRIQKSRR